ncbi:uncharacterized protein LOC111089189 [Limulus polyphemus]|uniref:Uncharacterized protein LOC111089189 n=1 Tax=Limulus polyphemus TaxID=6850 RepID=A0ABM1TM22_LIMPO|nr:uncharacterized protein LOC111089189 [Limulus polyphemus]
MYRLEMQLHCYSIIVMVAATGFIAERNHTVSSMLLQVLTAAAMHVNARQDILPRYKLEVRSFIPVDLIVVENTVEQAIQDGVHAVLSFTSCVVAIQLRFFMLKTGLPHFVINHGLCQLPSGGNIFIDRTRDYDVTDAIADVISSTKSRDVILLHDEINGS